MMVAADHGVRMQWNYTGDTPGLAGAVGPANPRWLRLTRSGDVITGYDSADGTHWTEVGAVTLSGLPRVVQAGLFAASPVIPGIAVLRRRLQRLRRPHPGHRSLRSSSARLAGVWTGGYVGAAVRVGDRRATTRPAAGSRVTGSGDIAPIPEGHGGAADSALTVTEYLLGTFAGLIALGVVAALFITAEYRRNADPGDVRREPAARPGAGGEGGRGRRGVVRRRAGRRRGWRCWPARRSRTPAATMRSPCPTATEVKVIIGTGLFAAVAAVLALAVGAIVRRGAAAVTIVIVAIAVPIFLAISAAVPLRRRPTGCCGSRPPRASPSSRRIRSTRRSPACLFAAVRVLPAVVVGGLAGAVRLGGGGAGRSGRTCCAGGTRDRGGRLGPATRPGRPGRLGRPAGTRCTPSGRSCGRWRAPGGCCWQRPRSPWRWARPWPRRTSAPAAAAACAPAVTGADPAKISLTGVYLGQVIVALLAVLAVGGEYGTGMIRVTLAATPRRLTDAGRQDGRRDRLDARGVG